MLTHQYGCQPHLIRRVVHLVSPRGTFRLLHNLSVQSVKRLRFYIKTCKRGTL